MTQLQFNPDIEKIKENVVNSSLDDILKSTIVLVLKIYETRTR